MFEVSSKFISGAKYLTYVALVVMFFGLGLVGWFGYNYYFNKIEQTAFSDLFENVEEFNKLMSSKKLSSAEGEHKLEDLEHAFKLGAERHSKTKSVPYFELYEADALLENGKFSEALNILNTAISQLTNDNPLYYLFLSKKALMKSDNENLREEGIKELNDLLLDVKNPFSSMAGYYLGLLHYHGNNLNQAKEIWQLTLDKNPKKCGWCDLINSKLKDLA